MTDQLRVPPHSVQSEQSVLGALLIDNASWYRIADLLTPDDFYRKEHRLIYGAISRLADQNEPFDLVTLTESLERSGDLDEVGGMPNLIRLADETPSAANIKAYAGVVKECAVQRKLISTATRIIEDAYGKTPPFDAINRAEAEFLAITENSTEKGPRSLAEIASGFYFEELDKRSVDGHSRGLHSGFVDFDRLTGGLRPGQLAVFAARPGVGKSTFAQNVAKYVALSQGKAVLFFSLEMSSDELMDRFMSMVGEIPHADILQGKLDRGDFPKAADAINRAPLYIDDSPGLFINQIRARALRMKRKHGLALLVVDYLQLVRERSENRLQEVSAISRSLKSLAKELQVPVIALSQLNRNSEGRVNGRPLLSDLRESGAIEQDADLVSFLYSESNLIVLEIAKQRSGPIGKIYLTPRLEFCRFESGSPPSKIPHPQKPAFEYA